MKIASKTRTFVVSLLVVSTVVVALAVFWGMGRNGADYQVESLQVQLDAQSNRLGRAFKVLEHDVQLLHGLPLSKSVLELANAGSDSDELMAEKDQLAELFEQLARTRPFYDQVRLIGVADDGLELVRVDNIGGKIERVVEADLQHKGRRDYFQAAMKVDSLYVSQIDLNREQGKIELPHRPMLRIAERITGEDGEPLGIVIINLNFSPFIEELLAEQFDRYEVFLTNKEGYYLYNEDASKTFGFDTGKDYRAQNDYEATQGFFQSDAKNLTVRTDAWLPGTGRLLQLKSVYPFDNADPLVIGVNATFSDLGRSLQFLAIQVAAILVVFLIAGLILTYYLSRGLTGPLEEIVDASQRLAVGGNHHQLPTNRDDEIGELARTFKKMSSAVLEHRRSLEEMNEKLVKSNKDLDHFSHIASHELREPINRISALAELLELDIANDQQVDGETLRQIREQSQMALLQITDFRVLSNLTKGDFHRETVNLDTLVRSVTQEFDVELTRRKVHVVVDPLPTIDAYPVLLSVIYRNLVGNALKYAEDDGFTLKFTAETVDGELVLGVLNTGSELDSREYSKIFQPFTRLHPEKEGTGMGLAICRRIAERHSGDIWVESKDNTTHFKFKLGV